MRHYSTSYQTSIVVLIATLMAALLSCQSKVPGTCPEYSNDDSLFVFIGEKICVEHIGKDKLDGEFSVRYRVLEKICGSYNDSIIQFTSFTYDTVSHHARYNVALLGISIVSWRSSFTETDINYPLYKTKTGTWATVYSPYGIDKFMKPVPVEFADELSFSIANIKKAAARRHYPQPFYIFKGNKAVPLYGNYVDGILKWRIKFLLSEKNNTSIGEEGIRTIIEISEIYDTTITNRDSLSLMSAWKTFMHAIIKNDGTAIRQLSLDSVVCSVCEGFSDRDYYNDREPIDSFIATAARYLPREPLIDQIQTKNYNIRLLGYPYYKPTYLPQADTPFVIFKIGFFEQRIFDTFPDTLGFRHEFEFVKIRGQWKFHGMGTNQ